MDVLPVSLNRKHDNNENRLLDYANLSLLEIVPNYITSQTKWNT